MTQPLPLTIRWPRNLRKGRVLFALFAYHGRDRDGAPPGFLERRETPAARGHRIVHRDHYANPRALPYELSLLASSAEVLCNQPPDVVIDQRWEGEVPADLASRCQSVERADLASAPAALFATFGHYDHIVFIYADALGLGCAAAEQGAMARHASVLIVNGRRRGFHLQGSLHGRLQVRRWLADTRIVERLLAALITPLAARLARRDRRNPSHV